MTNSTIITIFHSKNLDKRDQKKMNQMNSKVDLSHETQKDDVFELMREESVKEKKDVLTFPPEIHSYTNIIRERKRDVFERRVLLEPFWRLQFLLGKDCFEIVVDYNYGSQMFWKCVMHDVLYTIEDHVRTDDTQQSFFYRTGISGLICSRNNPNYYLKGVISFDNKDGLKLPRWNPWPNTALNLIFSHVTPPGLYFDDNERTQWINSVVATIYDYVGYEYGFIVASKRNKHENIRYRKTWSAWSPSLPRSFYYSQNQTIIPSSSQTSARSA